MKFVISTQELNFLVNKCANIVGQKPPVQILSNLMLEAKNGEIIITATDLTMGIRCFTEAKVLEEGKTTLSIKNLSSLVKELTAVNLQITTNENHVTEILADASKFKLNGMNTDSYPTLPDLNDATLVKISKAQMREMMYRTSFAIARDNERLELTGLFLEIQGGKAIFIATDGKRLSKTTIDVNHEPAFSGSYIIPLKAVEEMLKNLQGDGEANLFLMKDKIAIETENTLFVTNLLSAKYPDVNGVIPKKAEIFVSLHREELMTLLRQISLFTAGATHSVKFTFHDGELKLDANMMEVGEGKVSMPVNYHGPELNIAFNPGYFLDILRHSKSETVALGLIDSFNPGMITDAEGDDHPTPASSPLFVMMPMRIKQS